MAIQEVTKKDSRFSKESVSKQFVGLFYNTLNTHHDYLFQFYGSKSTLVVSEILDGGKIMTETADDEESVQALLKSLYTDITVKVETAVPQLSIEGSVLLHVTGIMFRKGYEDERIFTQALLLAPQENGYYILTDSLHVLGQSQTNPIVSKCISGENCQGLVNEGIDASDSMIIDTSRAEIDNGTFIGIHSNIVNDNEMQIPINLISRELATETSATQDDMSIDTIKPQSNGGEDGGYLKLCPQGMDNQLMDTIKF